MALALASVGCGCAGPAGVGVVSPLWERPLAESRAADLAIAEGPAGRPMLFVADAQNDRLLRFTLEGEELAPWALAAGERSEPVALAASGSWLLVAERAARRIRALDVASGRLEAELPPALGFRSPHALAAWPIRRGWHTVLVADELGAGERATISVWQMRRRPNGRTQAWRAAELARDHLGAPLSPLRGLAEEPTSERTAAVLAPDGALRVWRRTALLPEPAVAEAGGWLRFVPIACGAARRWLGLREDGTLEVRGEDAVASIARARLPRSGARLIAWWASGGSAVVVAAGERWLAAYRASALGLGAACP